MKRQDTKIGTILFTVYCMIAAFGTYFCMYAFRKPFSAGTFDNLEIWGIDYKILLVLSQLIGYTLSKFLGIKIISEMPPQKRVQSILLFIGISWLSLFFFGFIPFPYNFIALFLNGLPLGLIWGLVFSYLEGRKTTEILAAGLSASFIISSGVVKSVGKFFLETVEIPEFWMPFVTGSVFIPILLVFAWMLQRIPPPTETDVSQRTERKPMNNIERKLFFKQFASGLIALIFAYTIITVFRDFRDNFAADLWKELGFGTSASIFTISEIPVAFGVLLIIALTAIIKHNKVAFNIDQYIVLLGMGLVLFCSLWFSFFSISPLLWMILTGLGLYMAYVPYNSVIFERLIASFHYKSNAGFLIYVADAFGYLGSIIVLLYKNFGLKTISWADFFKGAGYISSVVCIALLLFSLYYFNRKHKNNKT
ncbi:MAG: DUF5690 family protein [Bacteroidales bacterium]